MTIEKTIKKIQPEQDYNLSNIRDQRLFPWAKDIRTIRKIVTSNKEILKVRKSGTGLATDYRIKGRNIIKFLEKFGAVAMLYTKNK